MKFLYYYRVPLPDPRADAIQIVNTCAGIARAGGEVDLRVESMGAASSADCLAYYGVDSIGAGRVDISAIGRHWSWPLFDWKTKPAALARLAGPRACLFVREVRPYVPGLIARAHAAGLRVIFEAHNISSSLVREKERKAAQNRAEAPAQARTFSMVSPEGKTALRLVGEDPGHHDHHDEHDDHDDPARQPERPPNVDETPAPPPRPVDPTEAKRLARKAQERAALEESILRGADGLICTQRATLDGLRDAMKPGVPATVLGNGTITPQPPQKDRHKDIDVLYCGSLKPWKGVDTLVAAMQTLFPHKLTVVGPGTKDDVARLQQAALAVGMVGRLTILPPVKPTEVWDLYARAKVGVIPLPDDGYVEARDFTSPLKLFEMMAAGLPIVCSRLKSLQEYVSDGREVLMVTADDPRPLAEGLRRVLGDEALRAGLAAAARARAAEFTWDSRGRKIVTFAEQLFG